MKDIAAIAAWVIMTIFVYMFFSYIRMDRVKQFEIASKMCFGAENLQWIQFGGMWGGFGFGCMPK